MQPRAVPIDHNWTVTVGAQRYGILGLDNKETEFYCGSKVAEVPIPFVAFIALVLIILLIAIAVAWRSALHRNRTA